MVNEVRLLLHEAANVASGYGPSGPRRFVVAFTLAGIITVSRRFPKGSPERRALAQAAAPLRDEMREWPQHVGGDRYAPRFAQRLNGPTSTAYAEPEEPPRR